MWLYRKKIWRHFHGRQKKISHTHTINTQASNIHIRYTNTCMKNAHTSQTLTQNYTQTDIQFELATTEQMKRQNGVTQSDLKSQYTNLKDTALEK